MLAPPLQVIDNFLLQYNVGQALLLLFLLSIVAALVMQSLRILAVQIIAFGLLFMLTPVSLTAPHYKLLGVALIVTGPMVFIAARG